MKHVFIKSTHDKSDSKNENGQNLKDMTKNSKKSIQKNIQNEDSIDEDNSQKDPESSENDEGQILMETQKIDTVLVKKNINNVVSAKNIRKNSVGLKKMNSIPKKNKLSNRNKFTQVKGEYLEKSKNIYKKIPYF